MFSALDEREKNIVLDAMDECKFGYAYNYNTYIYIKYLNYNYFLVLAMKSLNKVKMVLYYM